MRLSILKTQASKKNKGGRPPTHATPVMVRLMPEDGDAIDRWMASQRMPMSRPEAIRRLLRSHPDLKRYLGDGK